MLKFKRYSLESIDEVFIYKCLFLIYTVFLSTEFSQMRKFTLIKLFVLGSGILIIAYETFKTNGRFITKDKILLVFMILGIATLLVNNGKSSNLKFYLITLIQVFLLTDVSRKKTKEKAICKFRTLNFIFIVETAIFALIGIAMYKLNLTIDSIPITDLTRDDLIKGVYIISTSAALVSYLSLGITFIQLLTGGKGGKIKNKINIFYLFNLAIQGYSLILSGGRGAMISFISFVIILIFLFIPNKKIRIGIIAAVIAIIACFPIYKSQISNIDFLNKSEGGNFLNGRLVLWESGYKNTFQHYKLLGTGPGNMVNVTKELADTYLPGIEGGRLHNMYLDLLCSNGILGFLPFMAFITFLIFILYKGSFNGNLSKKTRIYIKCIFAIIASILLINIVESILIYIISIAATIFWIYVGYAKELLCIND